MSRNKSRRMTVSEFSDELQRAAFRDEFQHGRVRPGSLGARAVELLEELDRGELWPQEVADLWVKAEQQFSCRTLMLGPFPVPRVKQRIKPIVLSGEYLPVQPEKERKKNYPENDLRVIMSSPRPDSTGPEWAYVTGPVGSGKSSILRMLTADMAKYQPVIALQLQPDLSQGFSAAGASEFFDEEEFKAHVEGLLRKTPVVQPLLIVDGLFPDSATRLSDWAESLPTADSLQIICATLREDVAMPSSWGPATVEIRVDQPLIPAVATGTIKHPGQTNPKHWEMPLTTPESQPEQNDIKGAEQTQ